MLAQNKVRELKQSITTRLDNRSGGFSLIELVLAMGLTLVILGVAVATFSSALGSRSREAGTTDAITSTQAALNLMSREIGNAGFGLDNNGIVYGDTNAKKLRVRSNVVNNDAATDDPDEDITYYWDSEKQSVVRFDEATDLTSGVINSVSDVNFTYYTSASDSTGSTSASASTIRVRINLLVNLSNVSGQPSNRKILISSDVALRNSPNNLLRY